MERQGNSLGCMVAGLGAIISCCLLPYLISSVYSVASTLLQVSGASRWLWGDWLSTIIEPGSSFYRVVVELPVCCVGVLALLTVLVGVVWLVGGRGSEPEPSSAALWAEPPYADPEFEGYEPYAQDSLPEPGLASDDDLARSEPIFEPSTGSEEEGEIPFV